ncbi:glycosyltransferase [Lysobacter tyrosinilyticus]
MPAPARSLRILITNNTVATRAGSELYVRDLALELLRRGHRPAVYSTVLGDVAELLHQATVPVVDDLGALGFVPDVIHGQHHVEAMTAALHFPDVPVVFFCHGWLPWEEMPPVFPTVRRHVAVDELCAERLLTTPGIDPERVRVLYNGVDLERFRSRSPLPERPKRALIFSNYAVGDDFSAVIRAACERAGIAQVDVVGAGSGHASVAPEALLGEYDVVFAKARCALEAMAVGCATVVADRPGLAGMVTTAEFERLRRLNFGVRAMQAAPVTEDGVLAALAAYDPADAAAVSTRVRSEAGFDSLVDSVEALYHEVVDEAVAPDWAAQSRAAAGYVRLLSPRLKSVHLASQRAHNAETNSAVLAAQLQLTQIELASVQARDAELVGERTALADQLRQVQAQLEIARASAEARDAAMAAERMALIEQLQQAHAQLVTTHLQLHALNESQAELHRSRAWRALTAYRTLRARLL